MSAAEPAAPAAAATIAFIGNPNTGKSTLFNALSGARQRVGNFPGCTVEMKTGSFKSPRRTFRLLDLPGTYSLAPRSPDEMVAVDVLLGRRGDAPVPDAVVCIVDASNLERNLYLVGQVLELGLPAVLALNMVDVARGRGIEIDVPALAQRLGIPVVPLSAHRGVGLDELKAVLESVVARGDAARPTLESPFPEAFRTELNDLTAAFAAAGATDWPRFLIERRLLDTSGYFQGLLPPGEVGAKCGAAAQAAQERLIAAGLPVPAVEAMARYGWAAGVLDGIVRRPAERPTTWTDRIDSILTHRIYGTLVLPLVMLLVFQGVFYSAEIPKSTLEAGVEAVQDFVRGQLPDGPLKGLIVDGVIAGVGGVLPFLPQIMCLFFFIGLLEDCGYLARAAYLMDRLMAPLGLNGKSFIPLLSSFACAIPGIMAARVLENRRDRLTTILVAPLMSCSARLPVYNLLIAAILPAYYIGGFLDVRAVTILAMYLLGIGAAALVAWLLKLTLLKGETPPFVMELPNYKWPSLKTLAWRMIEAALHFLYRAGTIIVAVSVIVWAMMTYPGLPEERARGLDEEHVKQAELEYSLMGRLGKGIEPVVAPLGWDWKIGCAAIASFPAREVVVSVLGVIYGQGDGADEESVPLRESIRAAVWDAGTPRAGQKVYTIPVALSLMVFFSLCAQCVSTLAVMRRETGSNFWPIFTFVYMTLLAYVAAFLTYQIGSRILG